MQDIEAYPLRWPLGYPRTKYPKLSPFKKTRYDYDLGKTLRRTLEAERTFLRTELRLLKAKNVVVSTDIPLRQDGEFYSQRRNPDDPAIAVYFVLGDQQKVIACDAWNNIQDNIRAIARTIKNLRGLDRYKCTDIMKGVFSGLEERMLPAAGEGSGAAWWDVLEIDMGASADEIDRAFKRLAKLHHPDVPGGSADTYHTISEARLQGLSSRGQS